MSQRRKTMNDVTVTMYWAFRYVLFLTSILTCSVLPAAQHKQGEQPNILFLFADDLTYEAIRAFGHTDIDTPNIDRLVGSGTTFSHAYNMGSWSGAVCVASRTMLITGRSVWDANGVYKTTDKSGRQVCFGHSF